MIASQILIKTKHHGPDIFLFSIKKERNTNEAIATHSKNKKQI